MLAMIFRALPRLSLSPIDCRHVSTGATHFISVKRHIDFSKVPKIDEKDVEVNYVRGSGPGGQATNKTNNCVVMKHLPTGIVVKCHHTRSQLENKKKAMELLTNKLDLLINGDDAVENQEKRLLKKKAMEKLRRHRKRAEAKAAMKEAIRKDEENSCPEKCT